MEMFAQFRKWEFFCDRNQCLRRGAGGVNKIELCDEVLQILRYDNHDCFLLVVTQCKFHLAVTCHTHSRVLIVFSFYALIGQKKSGMCFMWTYNAKAVDLFFLRGSVSVQKKEEAWRCLRDPRAFSR